MKIRKYQLKNIINSSLSEDIERYRASPMRIEDCRLDPRTVSDSFLSIWFGDQLLQNLNNFSINHIMEGIRPLQVASANQIQKMIGGKLTRYKEDIAYRNVVNKSIAEPGKINATTGYNIRYLLETVISMGPTAVVGDWLCFNINIAAGYFQTLVSTIPALAPLMLTAAGIGSAALLAKKFKGNKLTSNVDKCMDKVGIEYVRKLNEKYNYVFFSNKPVDVKFDSNVIYMLFFDTIVSMSDGTLNPSIVESDLKKLKSKLIEIKNIPQDENFFNSYFDIAFADEDAGDSLVAKNICKDEIEAIEKIVGKLNENTYGKAINNLLKHYAAVIHIARDTIQQTVKDSVEGIESKDKQIEEPEDLTTDDAKPVEKQKTPEQISLLSDYENVFRIYRLTT